MSIDNNDSPCSPEHKNNLPIVGCLILFSVILGTTELGYIPVPTAAKHVTTMHLPTIVASILEGWPIGMVVGTVFGITSMYISGSAMAQDPIVALVPRILVGVTPYLIYVCMSGRNEYVRLGVAAVIGTLTNTFFFLGFAVLRGLMEPELALSVAWKHGAPEAVVAVIIVIPAVIVLRKAQVLIDNLGR